MSKSLLVGHQTLSRYSCTSDAAGARALDHLTITRNDRGELFAMSWFYGLMVRSAGGVGRPQFLPQLLQLVGSAACVCAHAGETMCLASAIDLPRCWTCRPARNRTRGSALCLTYGKAQSVAV